MPGCLIESIGQEENAYFFENGSTLVGMIVEGGTDDPFRICPDQRTSEAKTVVAVEAEVISPERRWPNGPSPRGGSPY